jgi:HPt (histidine-containing phosphotransfer) domain-containing protein
MAHGPATTWDADTERTPPCLLDAPAFDAAEFDELSEMIGEDGVMEMVEIFTTETQRRLHRLAAGDQTINVQVREMHTLKGAAGTVAAPRLTALGRAFERSTGRGIAPVAEDIKAIEAALDAWLAAVQARTRRRAA